ncbi:ionic transporter y4hA [Croceicoccus estronivorus]|uniref:calcium:proton antiporter n=1 Tax=Croceicoccus estronivorus TaxID=1172626 RepID=UPI0008372AD8|nr:ionic transporter y4hA [Croceicoccus estronivorus]OCC25394.1 ionic transporter y4hA [Croceicoccus estronivorus]
MLRHLNHWTWVGPIIAWLVLVLGSGMDVPLPIIVAVLAASVISAVHHAEIIAHKLGEPFGTLVLALAVTVIEVGLILSLMAGAGDGAATLARDTVIAAVMIILNGLVGTCLLIGGLRHREQSFQQSGVSAALATLSALTILSLVLPNFTVSEPGPVYSTAQLAFVAVVSLLLYGTFVTVQTVRHREYFLPPKHAVHDEEAHAAPPTHRATTISAVLLLVALGAVVLLAKKLSEPLGQIVEATGAPRAIIGVAIAALVLLPESVAATRAALANRIQTSLNLALGSALATIGLTIPAVAALSVFSGLPIALGLSDKGIVLLALTLLVATLSLANGRTTILQGVVHLVIFGVYLFTTAVP